MESPPSGSFQNKLEPAAQTFFFFLKRLQPRGTLIAAAIVKPLYIGSLSNDNGDFNENGKRAIGLDWQNSNFARRRKILQAEYCNADRTT